jgi:hypothetical protein
MFNGIQLEDELGIDEYRNSERQPKVHVYWAPTLEALSVRTEPPRPKGDPAVVFSVGGASFLLDFYDAPDERPIEHLIREYSEGKLP